MSKPSQDATPARRAVHYDPRSRPLMNRAILAAILAIVVGAFTGSAQFAAWPQVLLLHQIGWSLVLFLGSAAITGCLVARHLERRAIRAVNEEYDRLDQLARKAHQDRLDQLAAASAPVPAGRTATPISVADLLPVAATFTAPAPAPEVQYTTAAELLMLETAAQDR